MSHVLLVAAALLPSTAIAQGQAPPNIVVIIMDDTGVELFKAYNQNSNHREVTGATPPPEHMVTPEIDELAARGVLFRNAWSSPVCGPTRAALFSGMYGYRTGAITSYSDAALLPYNLATRLRDDAPTSYGVRHAIGKWHLSAYPDDNQFFHYEPPTALGFTAYAGSPREGATSGNFPRYTEYAWHVDTDPPTEPPPPEDVPMTYLTTREINEARAFVASQPSGPLSPPWFLWLALHAAHTPYLDTDTEVPPSSPCVAIEDNEMKGKERRVRCRQLEIMDEEIGRLMDEIDLAETTVFILGDNGSWGSAADFVPEMVNGGGKGTLYEGGINVPLIVAGVGVVDPDPTPGTYTELPHLVHAVDIFATILDLASVTDPDSLSDGISFAHALNGTSGTDRLCVYTDGKTGGGGSPVALPANHEVAIRDLQYKLIRRPTASGFQYEFYDLLSNRGENFAQVLPASGPEFDALNDQLVALDAPGNPSPCRPSGAPPPPPPGGCGLGPELAPTLLLILAARRRGAAGPSVKRGARRAEVSV